LKQRRSQIGFLRDDNLRTGEWRYLRPAEVARLLKKDRPDRKRAASAGKRQEVKRKRQ
jgi:hypothetical protein